MPKFNAYREAVRPLQRDIDRRVAALPWYWRWRYRLRIWPARAYDRAWWWLREHGLI